MKKAKLMIIIFGLLLVMLTLVACGSKSSDTKQGSETSKTVQSATQEVIKLKAIRPYPKDTPLNTAYYEYINRVNEKAKGRLIIEDVGGSEVYPVTEQLKPVMKGTVDILITVGTYISKDLPEMEALFDTFGTTPDKLRQIGFTDVLDKWSREKNGVALLALPSWYRFSMFFTQPVKNLEDFKGIKMRSTANYDPVMQALGMATVSTAPSEIYNALETGVVNGLAFPIVGFKEMGLADVVDYAVFPPFWNCTGNVIFMNEDKLESLPPDLKQIMIETAIQLDKDSPAQWDNLNREAWKSLESEYGIQAVDFSENDWFKVQELQHVEGMKRLKELVSPDHYQELEKILAPLYPPSKDLMFLP